MYTVRWNDHEGNCQELQYKTLLGAKTEAAALKLVFDGVEIISSDKGAKGGGRGEPEFLQRG